MDFIEFSKTELTWFSIIVCIMFIVMVIYFQLATNKFVKDNECYISHVKECLECHKFNLTYLYCSGFCVEQQRGDEDYFCRWNLNKNCWDLPRECIT